MEIDFRNFEDVDIHNSIQKICEALCRKRDSSTILSLLKELKNQFQAGSSNGINFSPAHYGWSLQSFIYFYIHLQMNGRCDKFDYYKEIITLFLNEIKTQINIMGPDKIWVDKKEKVTFIHALAYGPYDHIEFISIAAVIFKDNYQQMLQQGDKNKFTPLHIACKTGNFLIVEQLLAHGADITAESESRFNVLHSACMSGKLAIVDLIIEHLKNKDCLKNTLSQVSHSDKTPLNITYNNLDGYLEKPFKINQNRMIMAKLLFIAKSFGGDFVLRMIDGDFFSSACKNPNPNLDILIIYIKIYAENNSFILKMANQIVRQHLEKNSESPPIVPKQILFFGIQSPQKSTSVSLEPLDKFQSSEENGLEV